MINSLVFDCCTKNSLQKKKHLVLLIILYATASLHFFSSLMRDVADGERWFNVSL